MRAIAITALLAALGACESIPGAAPLEIQKYSEIDKSDKAIALPAGGAGIVGQLKARLSDAGWKLAIDDGHGDRTIADQVRYARASARYHLFIFWPEDGDCSRFDLALVDMRGKSEVLTMSGSGCAAAIADALMAELQ
jgi:hypothetical protein